MLHTRMRRISPQFQLFPFTALPVPPCCHCECLFSEYCFQKGLQQPCFLTVGLLTVGLRTSGVFMVDRACFNHSPSQLTSAAASRSWTSWHHLVCWIQGAMEKRWALRVGSGHIEQAWEAGITCQSRHRWELARYRRRCYVMSWWYSLGICRQSSLYHGASYLWLLQMHQLTDDQLLRLDAGMCSLCKGSQLSRQGPHWTEQQLNGPSCKR